jgi:hypothetical protein
MEHYKRPSTAGALPFERTSASPGISSDDKTTGTGQPRLQSSPQPSDYWVESGDVQNPKYDSAHQLEGDSLRESLKGELLMERPSGGGRYDREESLARRQSIGLQTEGKEGTRESGELEEEIANVGNENAAQKLKSEARRSTLFLHSMLSGASCLRKASSGKPKSLPFPAAPTAAPRPPSVKVAQADLSRRCGWRSGKVSRVLLAETPGFIRTFV